MRVRRGEGAVHPRSRAAEDARGGEEQGREVEVRLGKGLGLRLSHRLLDESVNRLQQQHRSLQCPITADAPLQKGCDSTTQQKTSQRGSREHIRSTRPGVCERERARARARAIERASERERERRDRAERQGRRESERQPEGRRALGTGGGKEGGERESGLFCFRSRNLKLFATNCCTEFLLSDTNKAT